MNTFSFVLLAIAVTSASAGDLLTAPAYGPPAVAYGPPAVAYGPPAIAVAVAPAPVGRLIQRVSSTPPIVATPLHAPIAIPAPVVQKVVVQPQVIAVQRPVYHQVYQQAPVVHQIAVAAPAPVVHQVAVPTVTRVVAAPAPVAIAPAPIAVHHHVAPAPIAVHHHVAPAPLAIAHAPAPYAVHGPAPYVVPHGPVTGQVYY